MRDDPLAAIAALTNPRVELPADHKDYASASLNMKEMIGPEFNPATDPVELVLSFSRATDGLGGRAAALTLIFDKPQLKFGEIVDLVKFYGRFGGNTGQLAVTTFGGKMAAAGAIYLDEAVKDSLGISEARIQEAIQLREEVQAG